jgi:hypothetical protein
MRFTLALLIAFVVAAPFPACSGPGPVIANAIIECGGEAAPQISALFEEFKPLIANGSIDWSTVYQRAKSAGTKIGGCFFAKLTDYYLGGHLGAAPSLDAGWKAHDAFEQFRAKEAGGATFLIDGKKL